MDSALLDSLNRVYWTLCNMFLMALGSCCVHQLCHWAVIQDDLRGWWDVQGPPAIFPGPRGGDCPPAFDYCGGFCFYPRVSHWAKPFLKKSVLIAAITSKYSFPSQFVDCVFYFLFWALFLLPWLNVGSCSHPPSLSYISSVNAFNSTASMQTYR